ncbi:hypothetical protein DPEC_G00104990 [Dallia pectoralis]|uniref:Uncharacterized protein n=1 Tax=Dallia pectoralis TaxID=75939 RepID=A0ACC2GXL4_DALPE|nr:hypothetical protein DPEC_G00104990 [Dallia pectoralis]
MADGDIMLDGKPLHSLSVADLKAVLEQRCSSKTGAKGALINRLKRALMLEDLKRTSTNHGLQPNSQIREEMSRNSFIKQYLVKQQELLRQRLEREAAEANENTAGSTKEKDGRTGGVNSLPSNCLDEETHSLLVRVLEDVEPLRLAHSMPSCSLQKDATLTDTVSMLHLSHSSANSLHPSPSVPSARKRSRRKLQPPQHIPAQKSPSDMEEEPEAAAVAIHPPPGGVRRQNSSSWSSSPEPLTQRRPGPLSLLARKMASEGAFGKKDEGQNDLVAVSKQGAKALEESSSRNVSMPVKQDIIRLKHQNKSIRDISKALGLSKSTVWYIVKKQERTGELSDCKRPGRPLKTTLVDDQQMLAIVRKNPFKTVKQIKNSLQNVGIVVSTSTIKRRLHQHNYWVHHKTHTTESLMGPNKEEAEDQIEGSDSPDKDPHFLSVRVLKDVLTPDPAPTMPPDTLGQEKVDIALADDHKPAVSVLHLIHSAGGAARASVAANGNSREIKIEWGQVAGARIGETVRGGCPPQPQRSITSIPVPRERSRRKLQPPQHIPPQQVVNQPPMPICRTTSHLPELAFSLPVTHKQILPEMDEEPVGAGVAVNPPPDGLQKHDSVSSSRSSSPETLTHKMTSTGVLGIISEAPDSLTDPVETLIMDSKPSMLSTLSAASR